MWNENLEQAWTTHLQLCQLVWRPYNMSRTTAIPLLGMFNGIILIFMLVIGGGLYCCVATTIVYWSVAPLLAALAMLLICIVTSPQQLSIAFIAPLLAAVIACHVKLGVGISEVP